MHSGLRKLIGDYHCAVRAAVNLLVDAGIPCPQSNIDWALNGVRSSPKLANGVEFRKHGYGCEVTFNDLVVDFDFGGAGEIDGFDSYRLALFVGNKWNAYGFQDEESLRAAFHSAVKDCEISPSSSNLYFLTHRQSAQIMAT